MLPEKDIKCHHTGFTKSCFECVTEHKCRKWVQILGKHPQTGADVNVFDCVDRWATALQLSQTQEIRQVGAAIESFRNQMVVLNASDQVQKALAEDQARQQLEATTPAKLLQVQEATDGES